MNRFEHWSYYMPDSKRILNNRASAIRQQAELFSMPMFLTVAVMEIQSRSRAGPTRCSAKAWPNWVLRPAAPRWASLRRSVLASGARSNPGTRHKSRGNYSLRLTARTNSLIAPLVSPIGTNGSSRYWQWRSISSTPSLRYPKYSCRWYA